MSNMYGGHVAGLDYSERDGRDSFDVGANRFGLRRRGSKERGNPLGSSFGTDDDYAMNFGAKPSIEDFDDDLRMPDVLQHRPGVGDQRIVKRQMTLKEVTTYVLDSHIFTAVMLMATNHTRMKPSNH